MLQTKTFSRVMLKKYAIVAVLTFSNVVYLIPYLATDFYTQFQEAYHLSDGELGRLVTFYGLTATPGYFIGGWLADRFDPKKLIIASCMLTGLVAVLVSFTGDYPILLMLHLLYGITSTMLNWGAYLKLIRMLGGDDEQGRLYGATDIAYGVLSLIINYVIIWLSVTYLLQHPMGFKFAIMLYAGFSFIVGVAIIFAVPKVKNRKLSENEANEDSIRANLILTVLKMPLTWFLSLFTLGFYIIKSTIPYLNPYLSDSFGVDVAFATAFVVTARTFAVTIFSPLGGWIRDRMGSATPVLLVGSAATILVSVALTLTPQMQGVGIFAMMLGVLLAMFGALTTTGLYTPITDGKVPVAYTGTILGIASAIGYSSDIWLWSLAGSWLDDYGNAGYALIWLLTAGGGVLMLAAGYLLWKSYKKQGSTSSPDRSDTRTNHSFAGEA